MHRDDNLFFIWTPDDIDSTFFEDTDQPHPLYVCSLLADTEPQGCSWPGADLVRGYDPRDGMFERGGRILESLGGIDAEPHSPYRREIEAELLAEFETRREACLVRGEN